MKPIAEMTTEELKAEIARRDDVHRREQKHLRALLRCLPGGAGAGLFEKQPEAPAKAK